MNALLVYPRFPVTYWGFQYTLRLIGKRASLPPLGLFTVAALLPDHWRLRLVDLNLGDLRDDDLQWADMVLTGGLLIQVESIQQVIARSRAIKVPVAVGGPAPTTSPELFRDADVVFRGEAEGRVDELVHALNQRPESCHVVEAPASHPNMTAVPVPRCDLLALSGYASLNVQYSRGCPFQCEFCDIIEIFGRKPRVKKPEQVIDELVEWLYSPAEYYSRIEAFLSRVGSVSATRASTLGEVGALLRTIWHVGVRSPRRRFYWRLMVRALLLRGRSKVRQAVVHAVQGEHLIMYTREHVVPRIESALAELQNEIKDASRTFRNDRKDPQQLSPLASRELRLANKRPTARSRPQTKRVRLRLLRGPN
ncbi:MAG: DUF4070 domain-containing protein [Deltaproteobacteria bacterium]|nr:DUF4070 domain-containing protein [Deltaproteobacteria bacterium]